MSIDLLKYFRKKKTDPYTLRFQIGRFVETDRNDLQYELWDRAMKHFQKGSFKESITCLLSYLNHQNTQNLEFQTTEHEQISFRLYQGSKIIEGYTTENFIFAEAKIVKIGDLEPSILLPILEENYLLTYTKFGLDSDNHLTTVFYSELQTASPYKLYYGLKELALKADQKDDYFVKIYPEIQHVNTQHLIYNDDGVVQSKYTLFRSAYKLCQELVMKSLDQKNHPIASYHILSFIYMVDYLLKPEGYIKSIIDDILTEYQYKPKLTLENRVRQMNSLLDKLGEISLQEFRNEMYDTISTFSLRNPIPPHRLSRTLAKEMELAQYHLSHNNDFAATAHLDFVVGYMAYHYALTFSLRQIILLYYIAIFPDFFQQCQAFGPNEKMDKKFMKNILSSIPNKLSAREISKLWSDNTSPIQKRIQLIKIMIQLTNEKEANII